MTELDQALKKFIQDDNQQAQYYDLILNSDFYIPINADEDDTSSKEKESVAPMVIESDGKAYMLLFDSEERLSNWAKKPVNYVVLAGYGIAEISTPGLHWAVNIGSGFAKEFVPDEIRWLVDSMRQKTAGGEQQL